MKLKALLISTAVAVASAVGFAAGKTAISVVPLDSIDSKNGAVAAEKLASAFNSLSSVNVKDLKSGLKFKAQMALYPQDSKANLEDEKLSPVRWDSNLSGSFTCEAAGLSGLRLRVSAYGKIPLCRYFLVLRDASTSAVIREAAVFIPQTTGVVEIDVPFDPVLNSEGKNYSFTIEPAGIEMNDIIGVSIAPSGVKGASGIYCVPLIASFSVTDTAKNKSLAVKKLSSADYVAFSDVVHENDAALVRVNVYSVSDEVIVFTDKEPFANEGDIASACTALAERAAYALSGNLAAQITVQPTMGTSDQSVFLTWGPVQDGSSFVVYRANSLAGPYNKLGNSATSSYIDSSAEPGMLYWYRVQAVKNGIKSDMSLPASGYKQIPAKGLDINKMLKAKKVSPAAERTAEKKKTAASEQKFLDEFCMNGIKMAIVMKVGESYVKKGVVSVFENTKDYSLNLRERKVYSLLDNGLIEFYGKKLFRIREATMPLANTVAKIDFGAAGNAVNFAAEGFSAPQTDLRWNETAMPSIEINTGANKGDMLVDMHLAPPWPEEPYTCKKLEVIANDISLGFITVTGNGVYRVKVPGELIPAGKLKLTFVVNGTLPLPKDGQSNKDKTASGNLAIPKIAFYSVAVSRQVMEKDLFSRLMDNAVFYCAYEKDAPVRLENGTVKYVPKYKAAAMSTEYYKNNKNWKGRTVAITTSDNKLMDEIQKELKKKKN